jgi:CHAT domain-containing protein
MSWKTVVTLVTAWAWSAAAPAAAPPAKPIPAYSPETQGVREGAALRRQGDLLQEQGRGDEAREAWQAAIEAYHRVGYRAGEGEVLFQVGASYQGELEANAKARVRMQDAMADGASALAEFMDGLARDAGEMSSSSDRETEALLDRASSLAQSGECARALPLFQDAGQRSAAGSAAVGELRAVAGRLRCQPRNEDPLSLLSFVTGLQEFLKIAQGLKGKLKAGPVIRYLRAAESAELGKLQEAETLLRSLLAELEAVGDVVGASRTALDLGCVLIEEGQAAAAVPLLERARKGFSARSDTDSERNRSAAETNLRNIDTWAEQTPRGQPDVSVPSASKPVGEAVAPEPAAAAGEPPLPEPADLSPRARARRQAVLLLGEGDRLQNAGRVPAARERWEAAAALYQQAEEPWDLAQAYFRLGDSYASAGLTDARKQRLYLDYFDKALAALSGAYESFAPKAVGAVRSLMRQARDLDQSGDAAGAMAAVVEVVRLAHALPQGSPATEITIPADELSASGRVQEARDAYQDLLCRSERDHDVRGIALALLGLGRAQQRLGNPSEAEAFVQRALGLLPFVDEESGESREAGALETLGAIYFSAGRIEEGIGTLRQARQVFARAGRPEQEAISLVHLSSGLAENGDYGGALAALDEGEALRRRLPDFPELEADFAASRAFVEFHQGKFQAALTRLYHARELYQQTGSPGKQAGVLMLLAGCEEFLGRGEEASALYQKLADRFGESGPSDIAQLIGFMRLSELVQHDRPAAAAALGRQLLRDVESTGGSATAGMLHGFLALSYLQLDKLAEARAELDVLRRDFGNGSSSRDLAGGRGSTVVAVEALAEVLEKAYALQESMKRLSLADVPADDPRATALLEEFATGLHQQSQAFERANRSLGPNVALITKGLGFLESYARRDPEGARKEMDQTLSLLESWASGLTLGELKAPFLSRYSHLYSAGVEMSLAAGRAEEAFRHAEEARARAFADQIGNQKIDVRRGADPALLRQERQVRVLLTRLERDLRGERSKELPGQNRERLENLEKSLEQAERAWQELGLRLKASNPEYASLISVSPVDLAELQGRVLDKETSLVEYFVPDGAGDRVLAWVIERDRFTMVQLPVAAAELKNRVVELRDLIAARQAVEKPSADLYRILFAPLAPHVRHHALVIAPHGVLHFLPFSALWDGKRYLGDAYALSFSPSATALKFARQKTAAAVGPMVAAGDPDGSLPYADAEARAAAHRYGAQPLLGSAATKQAVVSRAGNAGILHLAAHAVLNPINPLFTRIELAPDGEHDGNLEMHEVFGLDLSKTGLVILSGCRTQLGRLSAGDEIEGLTRAFLYAGTPAVIASLWDVDDESTAFLMERFYDRLHRGDARAEALRRAQRETRGRFPHPYDWAAFVLTGDGR